MTFSPNAAYVFRDGPIGSPSEPMKHEVRGLLTQYETILNAVGAGAGSAAKETRADLFADLSYAQDRLVWVYADPNPGYNGIWRKSGGPGSGFWLYALPLPYSFIMATDTGEGTPNAIQAQSAIPVAEGVLTWVRVSTANTGSPVTISFNGRAPLTIKTNSRNNIAPGGIADDMVIVGIWEGTEFQLESDQASAALQAAVEAVYAQFRTQYLGAYATAPTADPEGNPLQQGSFYWNTTSKAHFYFDGTLFQAFPFATIVDGAVTDSKLSAAVKKKLYVDGGTLPAIHSSQAVGLPLYMGNGLADGFGSDAGIDTSASSGYALDAANGRVMNAGNPPEQITMFGYVSLDTSAGGWTGNTLRQKFAAARVTESGVRVRVLCKGGSSGATFTALYFGHAASGGSFTGDQVQLTFGGGSTTLTLTANEEEWSDWVDYDITAGIPIIVSAQCTAGGTVGRINPTDADFTLFQKAGTDASTTVASGYTTSANDIVLIEQIDVERPDTTQNIALVTEAFEFLDFTPTLIKVSGIIEAVDALALNTDVTLEVSRNGGANWSAATMTQLYPLGPQTYFETNIVSVTGQPSGDDVAVRYKTFNLKRCYLHGLRTEIIG